MECSTPVILVHYQLLGFAQTHVHWASDIIQPSYPLASPLLLPSIFPNIRVSSNVSVLGIRWPNYWRISFSISPSNEYLVLISFRILVKWSVSSVVSSSLRPHELYSPWNSPGQSTWVGSLSLLQGLFPTQRLKPGLLHCRWILNQLSHKGY